MAVSPSGLDPKESSKESFVLYLSVFVMGGCGLAYEYTFSKLASDLLGNSVKQWAIIIGVMMFFMGVGSDIQKFIKDRHLVTAFILGELSLAVLGSFGPVAMLFGYGEFFSHYVLIQYFFVGSIGLLIGFEIPLLTRINVNYTKELKVNLGSMLRMDYMGALVGALFWVFVLPKFFNLLQMAFVLGIATLFAALLGFIFFKKQSNHSKFMGIALAATAALLVMGFYHAPKWEIDGQQHLYLDKISYSATSPYQHIVMTQSKTGDTSLYINGHLQFNTIDEHIYHENLVHPAMSIAPRHERVLVLGGGDGLAVREILKYPGVKEITVCDLDPFMTDLATYQEDLVKINDGSFQNAKVNVLKNHALVDGDELEVYTKNQKSGLHGPLELTSKVKIINTDAAKFIEQFSGLYDVVVIDFPDPNSSELAKLYSDSFYHHLKKRLSPYALVVQQSTSPFWSREAFLAIGRTIKSAGFAAVPFHDQVPSFGEWGFWIFGDGAYYDEQKLKTMLSHINSIKAPTRYLTPELIQANMVFGKGELASVNQDINSMVSGKLHEYYLQGWLKTL